MRDLEHAGELERLVLFVAARSMAAGIALASPHNVRERP